MSSSEQREYESKLWARAKEFDGIPRAESYHELSKLAFEKEEYSEAISMCLVAKEIFLNDLANNHAEEIKDIYLGLTSSYESLKECDSAEANFREAVEYAREKDQENLGYFLRELGRLCFSHDKFQESIDCHMEALAIVDGNFNKRYTGIDYLNLGMANQRIKNFQEAVRLEKKSLELFEEEEAEPYWKVNAYGELCEAYVGLQMADEIEFYGQKAIDWWLTDKTYRKVRTLKYYLAIAKRLKGELDEALDLLMEAREMAIDYDSSPHEFLVDVDKEEGEILIMQGKVEQGRELIRRAESVKEIIGDK